MFLSILAVASIVVIGGTCFVAGLVAIAKFIEEISG